MIELVVVIILLGILASVVLPRFISVTTEARQASLESLRASLFTGASLAKSECRLLKGCNGPGFSAVAISSPDGLSGQMYNGYPTSNAGGFASHITRWVAVNGFTVNTANVLFTDFESVGAPNVDECKVRYRYAESMTSGPTVELFAGGC